MDSADVSSRSSHLSSHHGSSHGSTSSGIGLLTLAPEIIHKIALTGYLTPPQVAGLSQTCRQLASILLWDEYGRDIHYALKGVIPAIRTKRWKSALYALGRGWYEGAEGGVWKEVAEVVVREERNVVEDKVDVRGWENVLLAALALPRTRGWEEEWDSVYCGLTVSMSLLHIAVAVGSERVVGWVMERGGDVLEGRTSKGATPVFVACETGRLGVVRMLVEGGADVMAKGQKGGSVLHAACQQGDVGVVRCLLGLGGLDVDEGNIRGQTPLHLACAGGHVEVVKILVEEGGADVDRVDGGKETPLFEACRNGRVEVVGYLLDAGADAGVRDGWGRTVLDEARGGGYADLVDLLDS